MNCKSFSVAAVLLAFGVTAGVAKADSCNGVSAASNLVQNCSFGTGTFGSWMGTATTDTIYNFVDSGDPLAVGSTPYQGLSYEAALGSLGVTETLTQTLSTVAGTDYLVEFALLNDTAAGTGYPNLFSASFGSNTFFSETNASVGPYALIEYVVKATGTSTPLTFTEENNTGDFELASVSAAATLLPPTPTPEPGTLALVGTGLAGLVGAVRRRIQG